MLLPITLIHLLGLVFWIVSADVLQQNQIYYNLTFEEFASKASESIALNAYFNSLTTNRSNANIKKRAAVGGESQNDAVTQGIIEELVPICEGRFGAGWRPLSGKCVNNALIQLTCGNPNIANSANPMEHHCKPPEICASIVGHNFRSSIATFAYCGIRINVGTREQYGTNVDYVGSWFPEAPKSPGTYNDFVAMTGGIEGSFLFIGEYSNGQPHKSNARGMSWSCIQCSGGLLKITASRITAAAGFSKLST
ncbi:secreted in xylem 1 protein [Colletotrichum truncatum]|uniref:Secreted in xylem 1 protein n=1 Tax=Colletotrichum truncatum TaxID=5467 RepID=A0ACC3ZF64_COLTU|nr:secreted in xylem 1 protein [Colletotrichum truncatum]KAF6801660.1 secreted in xylem 1 protein [Colletotrichum truncatum]